MTRSRCDAAPPPVFDEYAVRLGGGEVLLGSALACLDVLRSLQKVEAVSARDGWLVPGRVKELMALLQAELDEAPIAAAGNAAMPISADLPTSLPMNDPIEAQETAHLLGVKPRQVRNLAGVLEGRRVGGRWVFERRTVLAERRRRHTGRPSEMEGTP